MFFMLCDNAIMLDGNAILLDHNAIMLGENAIMLGGNAIVPADNAILLAGMVDKLHRDVWSVSLIVNRVSSKTYGLQSGMHYAYLNAHLHHPRRANHR